MPDQLQLRGGTTTEHNSFTGALREVTVDTTKKTLVVHDGSQVGGTPLMRESGGNAQSTVQIGTNGVNAISVTTIQDITFTGANSNLTWDKSDNALELQDNGKLKLGNDADLEIYHASDHSYVLDSGTGELRLASNAGGVRITKDTSETMAMFTPDGASELYFDNVKKLETQADRINAYGHIFVLNGNLYLRNGFQNQNVRIRNTGGNNEANFEFLVSDGGTELEALEITKDGDLHIANDNKAIKIGASQDLQLFHDPNTNNIINNLGSLTIKKSDGDKYIHCSSNAQVELYFDNDKKFETASIGNYAKSIMPSSDNSFDLGQNVGRWRNLYISDHSGGNGAIFIGASNDMELKHEGSFNFLVNHNSKNFALQAKDGENALIVTPDAGVKLYFNDSERFETTLEGCQAQKMLRVNGASGEDGSIIIQADAAAQFDDYVRLRKENGTAFFIENISNQSTWEKMIVAINAGAVELYYDHSRKLRTFSEGITTAETVRMEHGTVVANRKQTVYQAISSGTSHTFTTTNGHGGGTVTVVGIRNGNSTFATTTVFPFALRSTANAGVGSSIVSVGGAQGGFSYNVAGAGQGITVTNNDNTTGNFYVTFDITGSVA